MGLEYAVALSGILQLAAAVMAITLCPLTGKRLAWGLIASALFLMAVRRGLSLFFLLSGDTTAIMSPLQEYVEFVLSVLMLFGILMLRPIFVESRRAMAALSESEDRFRSMFEQSSVARSITAPDGRVHANQALCDMLGYTKEELASGLTWQQVTHPDDIAATAEAVRSLLAGETLTSRFEKRYVRRDGTLVWADLSTSLRRRADGEPEYFMTTIVDITAHKAAEAKLRLWAATDELTGIANRRRFFELAQIEIKRADRHNESVAVVFIDIDRLKDINDTYGHAAGDQTLITFAGTTLRCIREIDVLARLGGDEFALMLPATSTAQADATIERVRSALASAPTNPAGKPLITTISAGVAGLSADGDTLDMLLSRADRALYAAKAAGRDRTIIDGGRT